MKFTNYDFQQIGSWSIKIKIAVVFVACILLAISSYFFVISNKLYQLKIAQDNERQLKQYYTSTHRKISQLNVLYQQLQTLEKIYNYKMKHASFQNQTFITNNIYQGAKMLGLKVSTIKFQPPRIFKNLPMQPISLSVRGNYQLLNKLIDKLTKLLPHITLEKLQFIQEQKSYLCNIGLAIINTSLKMDTPPLEKGD